MVMLIISFELDIFELVNFEIVLIYVRVKNKIKKWIWK